MAAAPPVSRTAPAGRPECLDVGRVVRHGHGHVHHGLGGSDRRYFRQACPRSQVFEARLPQSRVCCGQIEVDQSDQFDIRRSRQGGYPFLPHKPCADKNDADGRASVLECRKGAQLCIAP